MSDSRTTSLDLSTISDPDVRRALRAIHGEMCDTLKQQQMELDALLEMIIEKNHGSLGEFKRHMVRLMQNSSRGDRIHEVIAAAAAAPSHAPPPGARSPQ